MVELRACRRRRVGLLNRPVHCPAGRCRAGGGGEFQLHGLLFPAKLARRRRRHAAVLSRRGGLGASASFLHVSSESHLAAGVRAFDVGVRNNDGLHR